MCSVQEDIEDLAESCKTHQNKIVKENRNISTCKKCGERSILLLQKKDPFCRKCFFEYADHKFRSTIGKHKKIKHGQKVLLACSGGRKSTALLHMTKKALDSASAKQISFIPAIIFIDESAVVPFSSDSEGQIAGILKQLKSYGFPVFYSSLEMVYKIRQSNQFYWSLENYKLDDKLPSCSTSQNCLKECIEGMCLSSKLDLIKHLRTLLMTEIARHSEYDFLFVGDSASSLAIDLLTDICLGRGSQISSDTNFLDSRYKVPICRPIREFMDKELALYNYMQCCSFTVLPDLFTKTDSKSSVQRLSESFISSLQEEFPATVFTIFRTGGKLTRYNFSSQAKICLLCNSELDNLEPDPCSAIEALKLSQKLSQLTSNDGVASSNIDSECNQNFSTSSIHNEDLESLDMFKLLCHGCSIPFRNSVKRQSFLPFIANASCIQMERHSMREEIEEFIIKEEKS